MGRKATYLWGEWLKEPGDTKELPAPDPNKVRGSLVQWARKNNKKVVTRKVRVQSTWGGIHEYNLVVTLIGDKDTNQT